MRKATLTLLATLVLALMMALSTTVALAGWDYEGDCPPRSAVGDSKLSPIAAAITAPLVPPASANAWNAPPK